MQNSRQANLLFLLLTVTLLFFPICVVATGTEDLAKQINRDLRQAERLMFSGKKAESDTLLKQANEMLEKLKTANPASSKVKSLENKYSRTRKMLDKKMGGVTASKATVTKKQPAKATASVASGRKGGYKQQMMAKNLKKAVKDVDYEIGRAQEMMKEEDKTIGFSMSLDEKVTKANEYLTKAEQHLVKMEQKYTDIPQENKAEFTAARQRISETETALSSWKKREHTKNAVLAQQATATAEAATGKTAKLKQDADLIVALHEKYFKNFEKIHGGTLVYNEKLTEAKLALALVDTAEKTLPLFASDLGRLAENYGRNTMDIYNTFHEGGHTLGNSEERKMTQLLEAVTKLKKSRQISAATLADNAHALLSAFNNQLNDARLKRMADAKKLLLAGQQFDPENAQIKQMLGDIDDQMTQVADKMTAQIDAATWAGNISSFSGPGNTTDLATEARKYFTKDRDWGAKKDRQIEILDVCVRGPWKVAETDVFGRVISWRLPIHVAVTDGKLKPRNIARVYDLSILAMEGPAEQAPKNPPYAGYWVGNSWMMRLDKF